ncbi:alpha/beta fold hydrolase [Nocardioides aurantiacus]|uniref:Pimeloyl-ACP methyl ester carboxylesterase n=1 Tax=Nocardioides aurantiacus TaxID=86796 RepID=A0A3N2CRI9_9ACTN|nr:alpha/beta fold hydrolase [Nocardioides aurantiacus]ROR89874.1 pimeloyl-ACP methyl ester carboxylesterase [Nocardioides aurantiacus]
MALHTTTVGGDHSGSLLVFCHGLFGQGRNWTGVAKALSDEHRSLLVDLPHHGRSSWPERVDYLDLADQVAAALPTDEPVTLVGHSMGGKVAMVLAVRHPELVARLVVVDVAPVDYGGSTEFAAYVEAMRGLDLAAVHRRSDAEEALSDAVPSRTVRDFLLQNLRRDGESWRWQVDLEGLGSSLATISGWPGDRLAGLTYDGPVLWVAGAESRYVQPAHVEAMAALFPHHRRLTVKGAGHWVHSEKPEVFVEVLRRFTAP